MTDTKDKKLEEIKIEHKMIEVVSKIVVDSKDYPIHKWNTGVIREFEQTRDNSVLSKLKDFSLEI